MSVRSSMFFHLLKRGLLGRGNRPLIAFIALAVASTMITAMLNLYYGLESKLSHDFRSYGANITVAAPEGQSLHADQSVRGRHGHLAAARIHVDAETGVARSRAGKCRILLIRRAKGLRCGRFA